MKINSVLYNYQNKNISNNSILFNYSNNLNDTISFSSKKCEKKIIPYRLSSRYQDDFHITSSQIYKRKYLELKNQGLNIDEMISSFFKFPDGHILSLEEKKEVIDYLKNLEKDIEKIDDSFKEVIPTMKPTTYYRGIIGDEKNDRGIATINAAKIGDEIVPDYGYPFMATEIEYAEDYSRYTNGISTPETCIVMIIKAPKGTPVSRDVNYRTILGSHNAVLARGAKFKVLDKEVKNNRTYVTLEYKSCAIDEN